MFDREEIELAKTADLCDVAKAMGYTVKRVGHCHTILEMDSMRIYNRKSWYRWSDSTGGSQIDFLQKFAGYGFRESVKYLLDYIGYSPSLKDGRTAMPSFPSGKQTEKQKEGAAEEREFVLPPEAADYRRLYAYLIYKRGLDRKTVDYFVQSKLIYEDAKRHNIVFLGKDKDGNVRHAGMRGTYDAQGKPFKGDVYGSDKKYGFNVFAPESSTLHVFEAAIDLMSYCEMTGDFSAGSKLALGMLSEGPLDTFLKEHPDIRKIDFCLDRDVPGREAAEKLMKKYSMAGYSVTDSSHMAGPCKDLNEALCSQKAARKTYRSGKKAQSHTRR